MPKLPFFPRRRAALPERVVHSERILRPLAAAELDILATAPVHMTQAERLLLYTFAFCTRPRRYLEIGTLKGGSALIVAAALDASENPAPMVLIDPAPQIDAQDWARLQQRATLIKGYSPKALKEAERAAGGLFDLVLVDGDHSVSGLLADLDGLKKVAAPGAYLLCHDAYYREVREAIDRFVARNRRRVTDLGPMTYEAALADDGTAWGGVRVLRLA